ncbi:MAG: flagellar hook-basal body complex protein FliE [Thermoplasmatales archaeon]|nr:MAG: flagellar hook-basal body complex protein FliE [Thermoplasmatales archaeon]
MKIIAFAGMPFSGKSEAVKVAKDRNIPVIRIGDMIWDEVKKQGLEINDKNVGKIANKMRKLKGKDIWAKRTIDKIKSADKTKFLVIDGIRNIEEIDTFKRELDKNFMVIGIDVPDEIRYKRAMDRGREDDSKDLDKIKERDKREIGWGLDLVISSADIVISNNGSVEDFRNKIGEIFNKI